jgi:hypothetical protein
MEAVILIFEILALFILAWIIFAIIIPYIYLPNFLFKEKIESSKEIKLIAKKLIARNKEETLKKVYHYVSIHFQDYKQEFDLKNLDKFYELFKLHNYSVKRLLSFKHKEFMWCYAQVKVILSLLRNTGKFSDKDLRIKIVLSPYFSIHQYALIKIGNKKIKVDPFYRIHKQVN